MQRRTLHADEFGRPGDITGETADLGDQIVALEHLSCLAQRQPHDVFAIVAGRHGRNHRADILRQHIRGDDDFRPATGKQPRAGPPRNGARRGVARPSPATRPDDAAARPPREPGRCVGRSYKYWPVFVAVYMSESPQPVAMLNAAHAQIGALVGKELGRG